MIYLHFNEISSQCRCALLEQWIFESGFEQGSPSQNDGGAIVSKSIALGEPVIYVSVNYRLNAFGFLASQEVKAAGVGNIGLQDQRQALRWVQKYISTFGGDPTKVTIWGESAGAISVALHMVANGGNAEGLFRAAFMESGSPINSGDLSSGQQYYDALVSETGCNGASDTLQCLRQVPFHALQDAVAKSPALFGFQSLALAWRPRVDGSFLTDDPEALVQQGSVARVPFVTGDCDDEGTFFALSSINITTNAGLQDYLKTVIIPGASDAEIEQVMVAYPSDITQGSPFDTGLSNAITPQFKRIAALLGDLVFQAPRRFFLQNTAEKQNSWAFLSKRLKALPVLGSAHSSDLLNVYGGGDLTDALINFADHLDPNGPTLLPWPQYDPANPRLMTFLDGLISQTITDDTYREGPMSLLLQLQLQNPL